MAQYSDVLLTADYDRTLTAPDSTIPVRNLEAIRHFIVGGGVFTVNTGRSLAMFRPHIAGIPVNAPLLLYNGSAAYDPKTGKLSLLRPIPMDPWKTLDAVAARFPELTLEVQCPDAHYCYQENREWKQFYTEGGYESRFAVRGQSFDPFLKFSLMGQVRGGGVAQLFSGTPEELARMDEAEVWLRQTFGDRVSVFRAAPRIIDVHAGGVSKLRAARALQKKLGRRLLVCVGDAENDRNMLEGADHAYCPADGAIAGDFPNVCPCADGSVAAVIYEKIPQL